MDKPMREIWVVKYALTRGVFKVMAEDQSEGKSKMVRVPPHRGPGKGMTGGVYYAYSQYFHGKEFFFTEQEALEEAERIRARKISNMQAQITKLQNLKFTVEDRIGK